MLNTSYHTLEQINTALDIIQNKVDKDFNSTREIETFASLLIFSNFNLSHAKDMYKCLKEDGFLSLNTLLGYDVYCGSEVGWSL